MEDNKKDNKKINEDEVKDKIKVMNIGLEDIYGEGFQEVMDSIRNKDSDKDIQKVDINKLIPNPYQPRKQFDHKELQDLSKSIIENGLFTPILVKENEAGNYYIVAGERRTRAARLAGLTKIDVIVSDLTDFEMQKITLVENIQRSDLNPIEVAKSLKNMMETQKIKQDEVSKIIGKSRSYTTNLLGLLKLDETIINGVLNGKITYGHARPLIPLTKKDAKEIYSKIINQSLSVRETEGYAKAAKLREARANKKPVPKNNKSQEIIYAEELVRNKVKSKVEITGSEIKIKFKGKDQLSRILERMEALEK